MSPAAAHGGLFPRTRDFVCAAYNDRLLLQMVLALRPGASGEPSCFTR